MDDFEGCFKLRYKSVVSIIINIDSKSLGSVDSGRERELTCSSENVIPTPVARDRSAIGVWALAEMLLELQSERRVSFFVLNSW